jgi:hypothetical protein
VIVLDEKFIAMWYFMPEEKLDFMGSLMATQEPVVMNQKQELNFEYRFRYYKDDLVFQSDDEKHWYGIKITDNTPQEALDKIRGMVEILAKVSKRPLTEIVIDERGVMGVVERMQALPMFHMQEVKDAKA